MPTTATKAKEHQERWEEMNEKRALHREAKAEGEK